MDSNINIAFGQKSLQVEFADSFEEKERGLGNALHSAKAYVSDCGSSFQFDDEVIASIWMKNPLVALDLAYIIVDGRT